MNQGWHLFDAKFKLDKLESLVPADHAEEGWADMSKEERRGSFKREDLYKMHTYRDAIRETRSAWILYPGTEGRFFSVSGLPVAMVPAALEGVGAIPLTPIDHQQGVLPPVLRRVLGFE